jgi:hypothetical protein
MRWLPEKVAQLKIDGRLSAGILGAADLALNEITHLMQQGYREHEAEEVALKQFILLEPEPGAVEKDWEREELAELERQYLGNPPYLVGIENDWETREFTSSHWKGTRNKGGEGEQGPGNFAKIAKPRRSVKSLPDKEQTLYVSEADIEADFDRALAEAPPPTRPLHDRIVEAYTHATGGKFNQEVDLADIRRALPDVARPDLDAELKRMHLEKEIKLSPGNNPGALTPEVRTGGLVFKGQHMHGLWITHNPRAALDEALAGILALLGGGKPAQ